MITNTYSVIYLMPVMSGASYSFHLPLPSQGSDVMVDLYRTKVGLCIFRFPQAHTKYKTAVGTELLSVQTQPKNMALCAAHAEMLVAKLLSV